MAEGFLRSFDNSLKVFSAGTEPSEAVHPMAVKVMAELGIDISAHYSKNVAQLMNEDFDYVITGCGGAREACPVFTGRVKNKMHIGFDDPANATGTGDEIIAEFRRIRDEIRDRFLQLYNNDLSI